MTAHEHIGGDGAPVPITALGKAVLVLRAFQPEDRGVSLATLQRRTRIPKTTLHRMLEQLTDLGLIERRDSGLHLGRLVFELGMRASTERDLLDIAGPYLAELHAEVRETVHLGVREGTDVFYVLKLAGRSQAPAPSRPGGRLGLHCTAVGKALLAHAGEDVLAAVARDGMERLTPRTMTAPGVLAKQLEQVRATGIAYEYEESRVGLVCVGAPVLDHEGRAVAAVSVAGPIHRFSPERHASRVRATAQAIAATLVRSDRSARP